MAKDTERNRYYEEYYKNEYDANRQMAFANLFGAIVMTILWVLYLFKVFPAHQNIFILINILFPIDISILVSPLFFLKTKKIQKPRFKYFLIFSFIMVVGVVNIILPKHGLLLWALILVMVNHYYNPKFGLVIFITILVGMLLCMYACIFVGEYDPQLIADGIIWKDGSSQIIYPVDPNGNYYLPDSPQERLDILLRMLELGENRFIKIFGFYYLTRAAILFLLFVVSNGLNKRTYNLLINEIRVNSEQEKVSVELNVAKQIQLETLPVEFIDTKDVEIIGELKAAKEVGGDFYDYYQLNDDYVAIVIADVSGKGIPAAMFMMKTITCFKTYVAPEKSPSEILKQVNKTINEGNTNNMFVTCFFAIINTKTGVMKYANAGHNPPVIGKNGKFHFLKCKHGFILGAMPDAFVTDEEYVLSNGESITLYTDGITEARNEAGDFYGEDRLINFFNSRNFTCSLQLHHDLKDDVAKFVDGAPQSDDMTLLSLVFHGDEYTMVEREFNADINEMSEVLAFVDKFCAEQNLPAAFKNNLLVVTDELFSNIAKFAYPKSSGMAFIRLLYNHDKKEFAFTIIDKGIPFNQLAVNKVAHEGHAADYEIGGLGILIVKQITDEQAYDRINEKNIITLKKRL